MKQVYFILAFTLCASIQATRAQAPKFINFQAVARNAGGSPLANQSVTVQFRILEGSANGAQVFAETHASTSTDDCGMFNRQIGAANPAEFAKINWAGSPKWLEVKVGNTVLGTQQMVSVPYALYAESSRQIAIYEFSNDGNGGAPVNGAGNWSKRPLSNEVLNNISNFVSFNNGSDVLTLQPGKYLIRAKGTANYCNGNVMRFVHTATTSGAIYSEPGFSRSDDIDGENSAVSLEGVIAVSNANATYVLEHWVSGLPASGTDKVFGDWPNAPANVPQVWTRLVVQKIE